MKRTRPYRTAGRENTYRSVRALSWVYSLMVAAVACCLFFLVWFRPVRIVGGTMAPALEENSIVLIDCLAKYWKAPKRGDIVLFEDEQGSFAKRVVALPGETVDIKEGHVYIGGCPLDESAYAVAYEGDMDVLTVPEGSVFVLGDNRAVVYDSRLETVGFIRFADIKGILRVRIAPISRFTLYF